MKRLPLTASNIAIPQIEPLKSYYPAFDYLRFALAVTVALGHFDQDIWPKAGDLAVRIFFALSGWLIGSIVLRAKRGDLPRFYFNRATRIWIPYGVAIILLFSLSAIRESTTPRQLEFLIYCVTFTWNWFAALPDSVTALSNLPFGWGGDYFWSICTEEQFYLFAPILILFIPTLGRSLLAWTLLSCILVATHNQFTSISLGVLAAATNQRFGDWHLKPFAIATLLVACAICGVLLPPLYQLASPFFAICVVLLLARYGAQSALGRFLGGASYPIYLNHGLGSFIMISVVKRQFPAGGHENILLAGSLTLGISIGVAMYLLIDRSVMNQRAAYFTTARGGIVALIGYCLVAVGLTFGILRWFVFA